MHFKKLQMKVCVNCGNFIKTKVAHSARDGELNQTRGGLPTKRDALQMLLYKPTRRQAGLQTKSPLAVMNAYLLLALCGALAATVSANDLQDQIDKFAEDLYRVKEQIAQLKERIDSARLSEEDLPGMFFFSERVACIFFSKVNVF